MVDKKNDLPKYDNIKGLVQDLMEQLDLRMEELRKGTPLEGTRPSDAKVFMLAARNPRSIADLSKAMGISRQAAHKSVQRLIDKQVIELQQKPNNKRDKIVVVTEKGQGVRRIAAKSLNILETEIQDQIGTARLDEFRKTLRDLLSK